MISFILREENLKLENWIPYGNKYFFFA